MMYGQQNVKIYQVNVPTSNDRWESKNYNWPTDWLIDWLTN